MIAFGNCAEEYCWVMAGSKSKRVIREVYHQENNASRVRVVAEALTQRVPSIRRAGSPVWCENSVDIGLPDP
jgi:hypothetical protein